MDTGEHGLPCLVLGPHPFLLWLKLPLAIPTMLSSNNRASSTFLRCAFCLAALRTGMTTHSSAWSPQQYSRHCRYSPKPRIGRALRVFGERTVRSRDDVAQVGDECRNTWGRKESKKDEGITPGNTGKDEGWECACQAWGCVDYVEGHDFPYNIRINVCHSKTLNEGSPEVNLRQCFSSPLCYSQARSNAKSPPIDRMEDEGVEYMEKCPHKQVQYMKRCPHKSPENLCIFRNKILVQRSLLANVILVMYHIFDTLFSRC